MRQSPPFSLLRVCLALWSLGLLGSYTLCVMMQAAWYPNPLTILVTVLILLAGIANFAVAIIGPHGWRWLHRLVPLIMIAGIVAGFGIPVVRALMPWEHPESGEGSPMAVLMSFVFLGFLSALFLGLPGLLGCLWWRREMATLEGPVDVECQTPGQSP